MSRKYIDTNKDKCICGKKGIEKISIIVNSINNNKLKIGCVCAKKFRNKHNMFSGIYEYFNEVDKKKKIINRLDKGERIKFKVKAYYKDKKIKNVYKLVIHGVNSINMYNRINEIFSKKLKTNLYVCKKGIHYISVYYSGDIEKYLEEKKHNINILFKINGAYLNSYIN